MFKELFKDMPLKVKISIGVLVIMYTLLLVVATPIAILFTVMGLGMWAIITIINYLMS